MRSPPVALAVSPHPDDELLGAPATLMALRDAGWRIVNLVCSLGRQPQRSRRRADLEEACRAARFELTIPEALPPLGHDDDLESGGEALREVIAEAIDALAPAVIVAPSPHDCHHAHEVVGRALRDAVEADTAARNVMFWGLWGDLPVPNVLIPFGAARLGEIERALAAHRGELERNRYDRLLAGRATAQAVLGPERVFGFGSAGIAEPYAEVVADVRFSPAGGWRLTTPRVLDPAAPTSADEDEEIGWWLHAPSVRRTLARR